MKLKKTILCMAMTIAAGAIAQQPPQLDHGFHHLRTLLRFQVISQAMVTDSDVHQIANGFGQQLPNQLIATATAMIAKQIAST